MRTTPPYERTAAHLAHAGRARLTTGVGRVVALVTLASAVFSPGAGAHPMGNFSINHYAGLRAEGGELIVRYRLDLAEIATAQEMPALDADGDGTVSDAERADYLRRKAPQLAAGLALSIDGRNVPLSIGKADLRIRPGAADLPTLLLTLDCRAPLSDRPRPAGTWLLVRFADGNYHDRAGWRKINARDGPGCKLIQSDVPRLDRSGALEAYPPDPAEAPPQEREVQFFVALTRPIAPAPAAAAPAPPSAAPADASPAATGAARNAATPRDRFTELISVQRLSFSVLLVSLGVAFALGSLHALSPGHGKAVVAAYLVGSRGTARHALLLGLVVTATHVAGVFALGVAVLAASRYVLPERLYPWLGYASGLLIAAVGVWQFGRRYALAWARGRAGGAGAALAPPDAHGHHDGPGGHTHDLPDRLTPGGLVALGVSGGILPCPSALVVLLGAVALHRAALGLLLIVAFSFGLASVLVAVGLLMLYARRLATRLEWDGAWLRRMPLVSPLFVAALGIAVAVQALAAGSIFPTRPPPAPVAAPAPR